MAMAAAWRRLRRHGRWTRSPRHARSRRAPSWPTPRPRELGELFEYRIAQPVTIRKDESAMLPFLQQPIDGAQAADLLGPQLAASHQCRGADQHHRQDARWRPDHRVRRRRLWRRGADGDAEGRRQAADQLCGGPGHAHHGGLRQQAGAWFARSTPTAACSPRSWPPRRPAPTPSATWTRRPRR